MMAGCLVQHGASLAAPSLQSRVCTNAAVGGCSLRAACPLERSRRRHRRRRAARLADIRGPPPAGADSLRMCAFALRLDGELVAGEFGAICGRSYTSLWLPPIAAPGPSR